MKNSAGLGIGQALLLEKCLLALELTGRLQQAGLNFIFKGGTSLLLHFDQPKRLSIDVDIVCLDELPKLEEVLDKITKEQGSLFIGWDHQKWRDREAPPTLHFLIYYDSKVEAGGGQSIQLDVIQSECPHAKVIERRIEVGFASLEEEVFVRIPTASSLLGDKLATLAPTTIGYPYQPITRKGKLAEPRPIKVAKHLFDLSELSGVAGNLAETIQTYQSVHAEQVKFRDEHFEISDCLDDTQDCAYWTSIPRAPKKDPSGKEKYDYMAQGVNNLKSHLIGGKFGTEGARNAAGRAALVAELVRRNRVSFDLPGFLNAPLDLEALKTASLDGLWKYLESIRRTQPNAFACWHQAQQLRASDASS
ncbi:MAG: nucleotidyl transferase AbiEii/AbiGii toxin family protein [Opitutales bacterium]